MSTKQPRLLKDLAARDAKNGKPVNGKPTAKTKPTPIKAEVKAPRVTKMAMAKDVFKRMAGKGRQEILAALQKDAKLTKNGAATYYYLLLKKKS